MNNHPGSMINNSRQIQDLRQIPGVGKSIALDLWDIGIRKVDDLKNRDAEDLYRLSNELRGCVQDRCLLYVFRCAVYFANTPEKNHDKELLKWWNWKDI
jgi:hypothetical protein